MSKVSIIIPTYSRPHLLPRAVESAFGAGKNVEVVVVDDASTDETAAVCRSLNGITYVRLEHNRRVAGARNAGVLASSGEYIALLDDDDVRLPGSLDQQLAVLRQTPDAALVYGQALFDGANDRGNKDRYPQRCLTGDVFWQLLTQNFIPSGAVVFRRNCLETTGLFDHSIPGVDDWDLWLRIAASYRVAALDQPVVTWRRPSRGSDQWSAKAVEMVKLSTRVFHERWLLMPRAAEAPATTRRSVTRQFSQNMASHLAWEAIRSLSRRQLTRAYRCSLAALRLHPKGLAWRAVDGLTRRGKETATNEGI